MSQSLSFQTVDAFTSSSFSGNPAAVVVFDAGDARHADAEFLTKIAAEFNLSETAFLLPLPDSTDSIPHYHLRWFTPKVEVPLCGHATLASAFCLFLRDPALSKCIRFETLSGQLFATLESDGSISLDLPADHSVLKKGEGDTLERIRALGLLREMAVVAAPALVGRIVSEVQGIAPIIEVDALVDLKSLVVDSDIFLKYGHDIVYFTQPAPADDSDHDIYARVFGPGYGIAEDPVTGSAYTALAPFWLGTPARSRLLSEDRERLRARQVSARGGELHLIWDQAGGRVRVAGHAVLMTSGTLHL